MDTYIPTADEGEQQVVHAIVELTTQDHACQCCGQLLPQVSTSGAFGSTFSLRANDAYGPWRYGKQQLERGERLRLLAMLGVTSSQVRRMARHVDNGSSPGMLAWRWKERTEELNQVRRSGAGAPWTRDEAGWRQAGA